jgi:polar amino acid transport system substrate-binding protein
MRVGISYDIPPYIMDKATKGLEVEVIQHCLSPSYELEFVQMPYKELEDALQKGDIDAAATVQDRGDGKGFYSEQYITFSNVAVSRKADNLTIKEIGSLSNHPVLTWENAYLELGSDFEELFSPGSLQRKNLIEVGDQKVQVKQFWETKNAVAVIDRNIFRYFSKQFGHAEDEFVFHELFPAVTNFRMSFRSEQIRDTFDQNLLKICENGTYEKLLVKYDVRLHHSVCEYLGVKQANTRFYKALHALFAGDAAPMSDVWSHADDITYQGPVGGILVGWKPVSANWKKQAALKLGGKIETKEIHYKIGRDISVVTTREVGENVIDGKPQPVSIRATSTYRKENGEWKMIGHHTDPLSFLEK